MNKRKLVTDRQPDDYWQDGQDTYDTLIETLKEIKEKENMSNGVNKDELMQYINRIEKLEEDKKAVSEDIKEIYAELKGTGYDSKIVRKVISIRRKTKEQRQEEEALLEMYMNSIGME